MEIKNIVVIGGGVLGSQIAYQAAYCGFDVTIWLRSEGSIGRCQPKLDHLKEVYHDTITLMDSDKGKTPQNWAMGISDYEDFDKEQCLEKANKAYENIKLENSKLKKEQEVNVFLHPEELEKLKLILLQMDEEITKSNEQIIQINDDISRLQSQKQINLERVKLSVNESAINENLLRLKEEKLSIEKNIAVLDSEIKSLKDEYNILIKEYNDKNNTQLKEKIKNGRLASKRRTINRKR